MLKKEGTIGKNQYRIVNEASVCGMSALFVAEIRMCMVNEVGDYRKRKDGLLGKEVECHSGELNSILASAPYFLCDAGQVI